MCVVVTHVIIAILIVMAARSMLVTHAYGYLSFPPATYRDTTKSQIFNALFNTSIHPTFYVMAQYESDTDARADYSAGHFEKRMAYADFTSLRELADVVLPDCGNSLIDRTVEPVNVYKTKHLLWRNEDEKFGFYPQSVGPCETWIDDERVQYRANCARDYRGYPAKVPVDFRRCAQGRICVLRFYWFSIESKPFKLMKHCVRIVNDPLSPVAVENLDPYKNPVAPAQGNGTCADSAFSVNVTITMEKIWLNEDEERGFFDPTGHEDSITTTIVIE